MAMTLAEVQNWLQERDVDLSGEEISTVLQRMGKDFKDLHVQTMPMYLADFEDAATSPSNSDRKTSITPTPKTQKSELTKTSDRSPSTASTESAIEFRPVQTLDRQQVSIELTKAAQEAESIMLRIDQVDGADYERLENYFDELTQYIDQLNDWQMQLAQVSLNRLMTGRVEALNTLAQGMESVSESTQKQLEVLRSGSRDRFQRMEKFVIRVSS